MSNYFGTVTKALGLAGQYFLQQIGYRGKTGSALMIFPYGTHASPKEGSFAQIFCNNGDPGSRTAIAWDMNNRPELADGDVAVYLPKTNTLIQLNAADESINITTDSTVDVNANDINMNATNDINMTAGNDINIEANTSSGVVTLGGYIVNFAPVLWTSVNSPQFLVDAPTGIDFDGPTAVTGNNSLAVDGQVTAAVAFGPTIAVKLTTHTHPSNGSPPTPGT